MMSITRNVVSESETIPATRDQIFLTLLAGVQNPDSVLYRLRGIPHLVRFIFNLATNEQWWKKCIRLANTEREAQILQALKNQNWMEFRKYVEYIGIDY